MIRLDERGKQCPLPVIEAKRALEAAAPGEAVEVVVDNEIAVQNLKKLADHKGLSFASEKKSSREYVAVITAGEGVKEGESAPQADALPEKEPEVCHPDAGNPSDEGIYLCSYTAGRTAGNHSSL